MHPWLLRLVGLGRYQKRVILAVSDFLVLSLALWLAMSVRLGELYVAPSWELFLIFCAAPAIGVATFFQLGLYRLVTRYIGGQGAVLIPVAVGLSALVWSLLVLLSGVQASGAASAGAHAPGVLVVPRSVIILYPILGSAFVWGTRQAAALMLKSIGIEIPIRSREKVNNVLIYGAGTTGVQLLEELRRSRHLRGDRLHRHEPDAVGPVRRRPEGLPPRAPGRASCSATMCAKCCWRCPRPGGGSARRRCASSSR